MSRPALAKAPAKTPPLADGTRTRLLDAAGEVFAESGFQAATIRGICARAGVNLALVNYHFGDKLELYTEVLRYSIGDTEPEQRALEGDREPSEAFREMLRATVQRVCRPGRPGWHFRLMVHEMAQPTAALSTVIDDTMRPMYARSCALIGQMLGLPPDHDKTRMCANSVIAQVMHYVAKREVNKQLWPELEMTPERVEQIAAHIADFSLAYLTSASSAGAPKPAQEKPARKTITKTVRRNK